MAKPAETYAFNLKRLRTQAGLNQVELAKKIGTARSIIAKAETEVSVPGPKNRQKICEALDKPESEFWRDPAEFGPNHERAEKVRAAVKSVLEAAGYRVEDLADLFGFSGATKRKRSGDEDDDLGVKKDKALIDEYLVGKKKGKRKSEG